MFWHKGHVDKVGRGSPPAPDPQRFGGALLLCHGTNQKGVRERQVIRGDGAGEGERAAQVENAVAEERLAAVKSD